MTTLYKYDSKIIRTPGGGLAKSTDCCCLVEDEDCVCLDHLLSPVVTIQFTGIYKELTTGDYPCYQSRIAGEPACHWLSNCYGYEYGTWNLRVTIGTTVIEVTYREWYSPKVCGPTFDHYKSWAAAHGDGPNPDCVTGSYEVNATTPEIIVQF